MQWSCSDLIFLAGSNRKNYPHNQEISLSFFSIPSKKIRTLRCHYLLRHWNTISSPTEHYVLSGLHRELRSLAGSDSTSSYSLSNSMHTFHIYSSFADKPSVQTWLWCPVTLLAILAGENEQNGISRCWKLLLVLKSSFFYAGNRSSC